MISGYEDLLKAVTMATEVEGALELVKYLKGQDIVISIGHSCANYEDVKRATEIGVTELLMCLTAWAVYIIGNLIRLEECWTAMFPDGFVIPTPE
jgi:N-acetylglucosamine-6-phosphate deacetylase